MNKIIKITSKYYLIIAIILIVFISLFTLKCLIKTDNVLAKMKENKIETKKYIKVDVKGKVVNPGVYELLENSRVIDQTTPNMIRDNIAKNLIIAEI